MSAQERFANAQNIIEFMSEDALPFDVFLENLRKLHKLWRNPTCPVCDGEGYTEYLDEENDRYFEDTCHFCDGKGVMWPYEVQDYVSTYEPTHLNDYYEWARLLCGYVDFLPQ